MLVSCNLAFRDFFFFLVHIYRHYVLTKDFGLDSLYLNPKKKNLCIFHGHNMRTEGVSVLNSTSNCWLFSNGIPAILPQIFRNHHILSSFQNIGLSNQLWRKCISSNSCLTQTHACPYSNSYHCHHEFTAADLSLVSDFLFPNQHYYDCPPEGHHDKSISMLLCMLEKTVVNPSMNLHSWFMDNHDLLTNILPPNYHFKIWREIGIGMGMLANEERLYLYSFLCNNCAHL